MRNGQGRGAGNGMRNGQGRGAGNGMRNGRGRGAGNGAAVSSGGLAGTAKLPEAYLKRLHTAWLTEIEAQNHYLAAQAQVGGRIYTNLARAEGNHARALASILRSQGLRQDRPQPNKAQVPAAGTKLDAPRAQAHGIKIEKQVILVYANLIKDCPDPTIRPILKNIQAANQRHLRALGGVK
jgi:rubrerythrin